LLATSSTVLAASVNALLLKVSRLSMMALSQDAEVLSILMMKERRLNAPP
jgi:hypothetical protein